MYARALPSSQPIASFGARPVRVALERPTLKRNVARDLFKPAVNVPAYRVHKAKCLGYVRLAGRMVYLGRAGTADSHERYRRVVAEWLATGRAPRSTRGEDRPMSVDDVAREFVAWARAHYLDADSKASSGLGPLEAAAKSLCQLYGATAAASFGPLALRAVRELMIAAGLCRNVVNQRVACVKRIFRWAVAEELVPPALSMALAAVEPLRKGRSGARETMPVRPVPGEHVDAVLPFLPPMLRAMVQVQRLTGMRSGELCVMRSVDITMDGNVWIYTPSRHKTSYRDHDRRVYLGPHAQDYLKPYIRNDARWLFSPVIAQLERRTAQSRRETCAATLPSDRSPGRRRYDARSYHRALRYAMRKASRAGALDVGDFWHPHQLRHLHATVVRKHKGLDAARILLGHRTLNQTLEYAEADASTASRVAAELG